MRSDNHFPVFGERDSEGFTLHCTCGWFGGTHQNEDDAISDHEDHAAGEYER